MAGESDGTAGAVGSALPTVGDSFGLRRFSLWRCSVRCLLLLVGLAVVLTAVGVRAAVLSDLVALALAALGLTLVCVLAFLVARAASRCCVALETLRLKSLEAQQPGLVDQLSEELRLKGDEMERALAELNRTQDRLISQQKLDELHQVTAAIAHEISNPLSVALNFSKLSVSLVHDIVAELNVADLPDDRRREVSELAADLRHNVERVIQNCDRAGEVVREAMKLGDARKGQFRLVDLSRFLRSCVLDAYHAWRNRSGGPAVAVSTDFDPSVGEVEVVPEDLARLVAHVVDNSCAALRQRFERCGGGGYEPCLAVRALRDGDCFELRFRDNGVGIADDVLPLIFNPFFTTRPVGQGVGLGLSLCYDVVREHGGTVTVRSELGCYTEVVVVLPLRMSDVVVADSTVSDSLPTLLPVDGLAVG